MRSRLTETFASQTRDEWSAVFHGSDACVSPVLSIIEAPMDRHNVQRELFVVRGGADNKAPWVAAAPRLSRTPAKPPMQGSISQRGQHTADDVLREWTEAKE